MKRVGIITLYHNNSNYGGILQAYALNSAVCALGYDCRVIDYVQTPMRASEKLKRKMASEGLTGTVRTAVKNSARIVEGKVRRIYGRRARPEIRARENEAAAFRSKIPHTEMCTAEELPRIAEQFDMFLCGSDQIWNMGGAGRFDPVYWLEFAPPGKGRASYAASMPLPAIPERERETIRRRVRALDCVSVRENQGKRLLEPLRDDEIPVVLDPVFLPETACWEQLSGERLIREPYIYVYLLGDDARQREAVKALSEEMKIQIVFTPYLQSEYRACDKSFGDIRMSGGPEEFLNLIRYADFVFTDSFHASVFSILFRKQFWTFRRGRKNDRRNMDSRLESLTEMFGLADRLIDTENLTQRVYASRHLHYRTAERVLAREKACSWDYLRNTLHSMEKKGKRFHESESA